jgi:pimeloyl-ACP methyl ester carboxylesterase
MTYKTVFKSEEGKAAILKKYDSLLMQWPVPYEVLYISTRYGKTHIIACGDTSLPPLFLLHGTSSNAAMWIGDVAQYSKYCRVYAIDMPGEPGKSEEKQYPLKGSAYHEWMEDVFSTLQIKKASLVGISLGAWAAVNFSVRFPEKVERLVLLCPSGIGPQKASFMLKAIPLMLLGEAGLDKITRLVNGNQPIPEEAVEYSKLIARSFNLRTESVPIFSDDELKSLTMPVLLYAGKKDVLLDSKKTVERLTKLLPNAYTNLLPDAGHVLINLKDDIIPFLISDKAKE